MPKEADFYTPSEAANMLGLAEFTILGLLTSGQLEGHQDERERLETDLRNAHEERRRHQEEAERLREELEAERSKGFWRRLFGG